MTRKEQEQWKDMGVQPRGIRAINNLNKERKAKGEPEVTPKAVNDHIDQVRTKIIAEKITQDQPMTCTLCENIVTVRLTATQARMSALYDEKAKDFKCSQCRNRWTKPRPDGKPHGPNEPCQCAHCDFVYPGFNYIEILRHCRAVHPEFYRRKWETEIIPTGQATLFPGWEPK